MHTIIDSLKIAKSASNMPTQRDIIVDGFAESLIGLDKSALSNPVALDLRKKCLLLTKDLDPRRFIIKYDG